MAISFISVHQCTVVSLLTTQWFFDMLRNAHCKDSLGWLLCCNPKNGCEENYQYGRYFITLELQHGHRLTVMVYHQDRHYNCFSK